MNEDLDLGDGPLPAGDLAAQSLCRRLCGTEGRTQVPGRVRGSGLLGDRRLTEAGKLEPAEAGGVQGREDLQEIASGLETFRGERLESEVLRLTRLEHEVVAWDG